jgi:hypothetical protein
MRAKDELIAQGIRPAAWPEVLDSVRKRLDPALHERFLRLHRNFVSYVSQDTLDRFYAFVFTHGLHLEINGYRFHRLESILDTALSRVGSGDAVLDVGAGAGIIASAIVKHAKPRRFATQDPCREARDHLMSLGFSVLPHPVPEGAPPEPFDLILAADSLGEINADDDGALSSPDQVPGDQLAPMLEERYGYARKLDIWKPYLADGGRVLLWEPISHRRVWSALEHLLGESGWFVRLHGGTPRDSYLELTLR